MPFRISTLLAVVQLVVVILGSPDNLPGQDATARPGAEDRSVDLIAGFDAEKHAVQGTWRKSDRELHVEAGRFSRAMLPATVGETYSLTVEFTRTEGDDSVGVILPVGGRQCVFNLSVFDGEAHGIARVDGKIARDNATTIRPGTLKNDHPYRLLIEVESQDGSASIGSQLDGRPLLQWSGDPESLSMLDLWKLPRTDCIGLVANSRVTFHEIRLRGLNSRMRMTQKAPAMKAVPPTATRLIEFEGRQWAIQNAASVKVERFGGRRALHIEGREQAFVYLPDSKFNDGTIEVDIASKTFSGIGFRGNATGTNTEKLYFRPFNSNTAKHLNTVQYSLLGRPGFGWRALREQFPGKYESGADIKVDEWFHVRLELDGKRMKGFVNDGAEPVLVVDKTLGQASEGVIGLWGWDSYFRNFKYQPKQDANP